MYSGANLFREYPPQLRSNFPYARIVHRFIIQKAARGKTFLDITSTIYMEISAKSSQTKNPSIA